MATAVPFQPKTNRKRWRFSLRSLLIAMTVLGALLASVFAPMLHELRLAAEVTRQSEELTKLGYGAYRSKRPNTYGLWLARHFWPMRAKNLGMQIPTIQVNPGVSCDIATLPRISSVNDLRFGYATAKCSDPNFQWPQILRIAYEEENRFNPPLDPDIHLLTHFPNVEEVRIWRVPAETLVLKDLPSCKKLRRLELSLDGRWITVDGERIEVPLNVEPLRGLSQLQELQIIKLPKEVDWSFLADMTSLQQVEINPFGWRTSGAILKPDTREPLRTRDETPLPHLTRLPQLRSLILQSTPAYAVDLELLAKHTSIERLQLEHIPEGPTALAGLRHAKSLRSLHLQLSQFDDLLSLRAELQQLTQLRELSCEFREFTFDHAQLLASLKQLETLRITHINQYSAGPAGRVVLSETPLIEIQGHITVVGPGTFKDIEKLMQLAGENRRQRERQK
jgi:hypothetical protein